MRKLCEAAQVQLQHYGIVLVARKNLLESQHHPPTGRQQVGVRALGRRSARRQRAGLVSRALVQEAAEQHMTLTEAVAVEVQGEQVLEDVVEPLHFCLEDAV